MTKIKLCAFTLAAVIAAQTEAAAQEFNSDGKYVFSAEYLYSYSMAARFRNQADSILNWQDIYLGGLLLGLEKNGYGAKIWHSGGDEGYSTDDDLFNKYYAVSTFDVDTTYFGFDFWAPFKARDNVKARWGVEFSRLAFRGYVRMDGKAHGKAGQGQFTMDVSEFTNGVESEDYAFHSLVPYIGANVVMAKSENGKHVVYLDGRVGAGWFYGHQEWLSSKGDVGIDVKTYAFPILQFRTEAEYEYAITPSTTVGITFGYKGQSLGGADVSKVTINKNALDPNDPRQNIDPSSTGAYMKDVNTNEYYTRFGFKFAI